MIEQIFYGILFLFAVALARKAWIDIRARQLSKSLTMPKRWILEDKLNHELEEHKKWDAFFEV